MYPTSDSVHIYKYKYNIFLISKIVFRVYLRKLTIGHKKIELKVIFKNIEIFEKSKQCTIRKLLASWETSSYVHVHYTMYKYTLYQKSLLWILFEENNNVENPTAEIMV